MAIHSSNTSIPKIDNSEELPSVNILSIDFDWIMAPSIEAYNLSTYEEGDDVWALHYSNATYFFPADLQKYYELCNIIKRVGSIDTIVTDSHRNLTDAVAKWTSNQQAIHIYNIDHHHDLGYYSDSKPCPPECDLYELLSDSNGCANWALFLNRKIPQRFQYYTWIHNDTSNIDYSLPIEHYFSHFTATTDIHILDNIKIDKLFICHSSRWIPPMYRPLFDAMLLLIDKKENI